MATVKIFVNGQKVDLVKSTDFPLILKRELPKNGNISERTGDGTYSFKIPMTPNNQKVFGALYLPQSENDFYKSERLSIDIYVDEQDIMIGGYLTIESATENELEVSAVSPNISWGVLVGNKKLRELGKDPTGAIVRPVFKTFIMLTGNEINEVNDAIDTSNPLAYTHSDAYDVAFPLTAYSPFFVPNSWSKSGRNWISQKRYVRSAAGFNAYGEVTLPPDKLIYGIDTYTLGATNNAGNANLNFLTFPPAVYIRSIIRAIFDDIGYAVIGTIFDDVEFRKLLLLYTGERPPQWPWNNLSKSLVTSANATLMGLTNGNGENVTVSVGFEVTFGNANGNRLADIMDVEVNNSFALIYGFTNPPPPIAPVFEAFYLAPTTGRYRFNVKLQGNTSTNLWNVYLIVFAKPENSDEPLYEGVVTGGGIPDFIFGERVLYSEVIAPPGTFVPLNLDTTFELDLTLNQSYYVAFAGVDNTVNFLIDNVGFENSLYVSIECISSRDTLDVAANLPNITQKEFLQWMIRNFNLYIDVNEKTRTAYIDAYINFFTNAVHAIELRNRCAIYGGKKTPNQQAKTFSFQYSDDETDYLLTRRGGFKRYGTDYINIVRDAGGVEDVTPGIAPTEFDVFNIVDDVANNFVTPDYRIKATITIPYLTTVDKYFVIQNELEERDDDYQWVPRIVKVKSKAAIANSAFLPFRWWDISQAVANRDSIRQVTEYIRCVFDDTDTPVGSPVVWSLTMNQANQRGLFRLYEPLIIELQKGYQLEIAIQMDTPLYRAMTVRQLVSIDGGLYRVVKIAGFRPLVEGNTTITLKRVI